MVLQLQQLDSEMLQHVQEKAERLGPKANKLPRSAHRSEGDPFADTGPTGQHNHLPSDDDEVAGKRASRNAADVSGVHITNKAIVGLMARSRLKVSKSLLSPAPNPINQTLT